MNGLSKYINDDIFLAIYQKCELDKVLKKLGDVNTLSLEEIQSVQGHNHKYKQLFVLFDILENKFGEDAIKTLKNAFKAANYGFLATGLDRSRLPSFDYPSKMYRMKSVNELEADKRHVGLALIIYNCNFAPRINRYHKICRPTGSLPWLKDGGENLRECLQEMKYHVIVKKNRKKHEIEHDIQKFATKPDHKKFDSCIVAILSHGFRNYIIGTDLKEVDLNIIVSAFDATECPNLAGKPKIFLSSACRSPKLRPRGFF